MSNLHLFKDSITLTDYDVLIQELTAAVEAGTSTLTKLLFGTETPDLYSNHGKYHRERHNRCAGLAYSEKRNFTEKRLCKCLYYTNGDFQKACDKCGFQNRYEIVGDYDIVDYEVPAFYYGDGIGEIDLIISKDNICYATEVKPYKGNNETLLRMIAEIMTYTEGYPAGIYKKAIAFFEKNRDDGKKTKQQEEYEASDPAIFALLKKADITVFRFEEVSEKVYRICKL